jgi:3-deoxy-7-phosphoheptulonate synthase
MIIVLRPDASKEQRSHLLDKIKEWGLKAHISEGAERTIVGVIGDESVIRTKPLEAIPGVDSVMPILKPYKLASVGFHEEPTQIILPPIREGDAPVVIGGEHVAVMAGPCSVENREMLFETAQAIQSAGARILRAGAFKPRSSPYAFQGLGVEGLRYLAEVREETGLQIITEVMDTRDVELVAEVADILQIGARNMQNFNLLKVVGQTNTPVLIKRGLSSTLQELLMSAEYVLSQGNSQVILCERGIRTFEPMTRNTLDLSAVPVLARESHLPVIIDPSHATGHRELVAPMARAAIAAGAAGVMVEVHPRPEEAVSDGAQSLTPSEFSAMMQELRPLAEVMKRTMD